MTEPKRVLIVATPGADASCLVDALASRRELAVASLASGSLDGGAPAAAFAAGLGEGRLIFVASDADGPQPPELPELPRERWCRVVLERLLADPAAEMRHLCADLGVAYDQALLGPIEAVRRRSESLSNGRSSPFASVSTANVAELLEQTGSSLLVSTYQTDRLVSVRADDGALNTHFRYFDKPMGIAVAPGRIALGTRSEVWDFRDMPAAAGKLSPEGRHDACFLPRNRHVTGDIAVHDLAFAGGDLWLAATAFSCLATLDAGHSFVPRWAPSFITALAPEDRCHLNGLAVVEDRVAYVTALGMTDQAAGWRAEKVTGGVLIDVASGEVAIPGLCMPHSPRWHRDQLWFLESGTGGLCRADLQRGGREVVAELPGFTRGLAFLDDIALVGLSQIRESATFGDLPLTRRAEERQSGVWMVHLRSGTVVGFLRFEDLVQEIFDVAILPGTGFPEIAEATDETTARSYALP